MDSGTNYFLSSVAQRAYYPELVKSFLSVLLESRHVDTIAMSTKVIYFTIRGKLEKAEFSTDDTSDEVTGNILAISLVLFPLE